MKKNIIHIALGKANPERQNGVNKVVNSLVSHQVSNGFKAKFWGISFSDEHNYPIRNYITRLFKDYRSKFKIDPDLKNAIADLEPENTVVHIHGAFIPQFYTIAKRLKKNNIPYFFTPHGGYNLKALERSKWVKRIYIRLFERFVVNNAIGVQLLGDSEKFGAEKYFENTFAFIPNGQELQTANGKARADKAAVRVGFLGRIDIKTKGLDILLDGIRKAKESLNIRLEIIGAGGDIDALKQMVTDLDLTDQVVFKGAVFGDEKLALLSNWDALCLTSRNEGIPGVVLEAASLGVPSIVSEATNMGKYIRNYDSGWVLQKNTGSGLSKVLRELCQTKRNNAYLAYKKAARTMVRSEFDWNVIVKRLVTAYE